jgi:hypothetical protein
MLAMAAVAAAIALSGPVADAASSPLSAAAPRHASTHRTGVSLLAAGWLASCLVVAAILAVRGDPRPPPERPLTRSRLRDIEDWLGHP